MAGKKIEGKIRREVSLMSNNIWLVIIVVFLLLAVLGVITVTA